MALPALQQPPPEHASAPASLSVEEIVAALSVVEDDRFPTEAFAAALARREELTPHLLEALEMSPREVIGRYGELPEDRSFMLPVLAMFLLAAYRETWAFPLIVRFFAVDPRWADHATGDLATEDLASILAATYNGNVAPLLAMIADWEGNEYVACSGLKALRLLADCGSIDRERAVDHVEGLLARLPRDKAKQANVSFWTFFSDAAIEFRAERLRPHLLELHDQGLIDRNYLSREELVQELDDPLVAPGLFDRLSDSDEVSRHLSERLWMFTPYGHDPDHGEEALALKDILVRIRERQRQIEAILPDVPVEAMRPPRIGRNEPCPCGSGKKYKKCCIDNG